MARAFHLHIPQIFYIFLISEPMSGIEPETSSFAYTFPPSHEGKG